MFGCNWDRGDQGDGLWEVVTLDPEHGTLAASMEMTHGCLFDSS